MEQIKRQAKKGHFSILRLCAGLALLFCLVFLTLCTSAEEIRWAGWTAEEITDQLTLEQKASQMVH